jgi:hypothetical protein
VNCYLLGRTCHIELVIFAIMLMVNSGTVNGFSVHFGDMVDLNSLLLKPFVKM